MKRLVIVASIALVIGGISGWAIANKVEANKATAEIHEMNEDILNVSDQLDESLNKSKFIQLLKSMN